MVGSPLHLTEVREAESRMALIFLKTVTLTGRARRAPPEDRDSTHVGNLDCKMLSSGDLILISRRVPFIFAWKQPQELDPGLPLRLSIHTGKVFRQQPHK